MTLEATPGTLNANHGANNTNGFTQSIHSDVTTPKNQLPVQTRTTLLTGATGALGQELMWNFLQNRPSHEKLLVLARGKTKSQNPQDRTAAAQRRVNILLGQHFSPDELTLVGDRVTVIDGDVTAPYLGLDAKTFANLAQQVDSVLHCAAAVRFDQSLVEARHINVEGTRQALQLARHARQNGREGRFDYISTAYVAGKRKGLILEDELEHKKGFRNTYEQSKYEAEQMVRLVQDEIPTTILRPSIIIGNSRTGETSNFKAFYWPIRVYASGQLRLLPGVANCRVDLVPVDYVAAATLHLTGLPHTVGGCFHLTTGHDNLVTLREIMDATIEFFSIKPPPLVNPTLVKLLEGHTGRLLLGERVYKTLMLGMPYYPYLALNLEFDDTQARQHLDAAGVYAPSIRDFFNRLFQYCVETNWGHKAPNGH